MIRPIHAIFLFGVVAVGFVNLNFLSLLQKSSVQLNELGTTPSQADRELNPLVEDEKATREIATDAIARAPQSDSTEDSKAQPLKFEASDVVEATKEGLERSSGRQLTFDDLVINDFLGRGAVNYVYTVSLPTWWYEQNGVDKKERFVIKFTAALDDGFNEINILETLNADPALAKKHKIMPIIFGERNLTSPFYEGLDESVRRALPSSDTGYRLLRAQFLSTHVVPFYDDGRNGNYRDINDIRKSNDIGRVQRFMQSYIGMMAYAHNLGIENNDLSNSNVYRDKNDDKPLVADWNGYMKVGSPIYQSDANWALTAPEGILEHVNNEKIQVTITGAQDIWSIGYWFADVIFYPCRWHSHGDFSSQDDYWHHDFLREILLAVGGSTRIPINVDGKEADIAPIVGLDGDEVAKRPFTPPLKGRQCSLSNDRFPVLDSHGPEVKKMAIDFLRNMMKVDPRERMTCTQLLQHPFLTSDLDNPDKNQALPSNMVLAEAPEINDRKLAFDDLIIGNFLGRGVVNDVFEVTLPTWWYEQNGIDRKDRFVIKFTAKQSLGSNEIDLLEKLNTNPTAAKQHKIMPFVYGERNLTNPFYEGLDESVRRTLPPNESNFRLTGEPFLCTHIVPFYDETTDEYGNIDEVRRTYNIRRIQRFMKSYVATMAYAHNLGIGNNDLTQSNVYLDRKDDRPLVADWNAFIKVGDPIYVDDAFFTVASPEAMLEHVNNELVPVTNAGAQDVWAMGVWFADTIFYPCEWHDFEHYKTQDIYPRHHDYLRATLLAVGGKTTIPVDMTGREADIAPIVGLDRDEVAKRPFIPPIFGRRGALKGMKCSLKQFHPNLDSEGPQVRDMALDFLRKMMKIDPRERINCTQLLEHPFLTHQFDGKKVPVMQAPKTEIATKQSIDRTNAGIYV